MPVLQETLCRWLTIEPMCGRIPGVCGRSCRPASRTVSALTTQDTPSLCTSGLTGQVVVVMILTTYSDPRAPRLSREVESVSSL